MINKALGALKEAMSPRPLGVFYSAYGKYRMDFEDALIEIATCLNQAGEITLSKGEIVYGQGAHEPMKQWARSPEMDQVVAQWATVNKSDESNFFGKYRAQNIGALLKHMTQDEAEETIKQDWDRIKWKYWSYAPQQLSQNVLWCETFTIEKLRGAVNRLREKRIKEGTLEALKDHVSWVPYDPALEALGSSFYPAIKIKLKEVKS